MRTNTFIDVDVDGKHIQGSKSVRVRFGEHHFVEILSEDGNVKFSLGATHHGFSADASEVSGQLETIVDEVKSAHRELAF